MSQVNFESKREASAFAHLGANQAIGLNRNISNEESISRLGSVALGSHLGAAVNEIRSLDIRIHELRERLAPILKESEPVDSINGPSDLLYPDCPLAVVAAELHSSLLGIRLNLDSLLRDLAI